MFFGKDVYNVLNSQLTVGKWSIKMMVKQEKKKSKGIIRNIFNRIKSLNLSVIVLMNAMLISSKLKGVQ